MKKQIAIFAALVFFLAQFGKVINYCFCKAETYQQTSSFVCDCEKQLYTAIKTDNTSKEKSPQNISSTLPTEELFHIVAVPVFITRHNLYVTKWPATSSESLYYRFQNAIFHPPLSSL